jgi:uroporphyrinogen decarboxylase
MQSCLRGEKVDRTPVSLWRHFPVDDQTPENLAQATLQFQSLYDFDLVKVSPSSSFCLKDWGVEDAWMGDTEGTRRYTKRVIAKPQDWERLPVLEPTADHLDAQLTCLRLIRAGLGPEVPMIQTIFSPLAQAKNLAGAERLLVHLRRYPQALLKGLETITESTRRFMETARDVGVDGFFYAVQHAQAHLLSEGEYTSFGMPFDRMLLDPVQDLWCNVLHIHGQDIFFDLMATLNLPIINWHDRDTEPSLSKARKEFAGVVCGGIGRDTLVYQDPEQVQKEAEEALKHTGETRFVLSTGCVVPIIAPHGNILKARRSVE